MSGYTVQPTAPVADGCKFVRWNYVYYSNTEVDEEGNPVPRSGTLSAGGSLLASIFTRNPRKTVALTADWNKMYRMRRDYQANGDTVTGPSSMEFMQNNPTSDYTYSVYKGDPHRDGYVFVCWSKYPDRAEEVTELAESDFSELVDGRWQATVYAIWTKRVNLTYNGNFPLYDGADMPTKSYAGNPNTFTIQSIPTLFTQTTYETYSKGHTFLNWNTEPDGSGTAYEVDNTVTFNEDTTLYAQWTRNFVVRYNSNSPYSGSTTISTFRNFPANENFSVPVSELTDSSRHALSEEIPITNGYDFVGWSLAPDSAETTDSVLLSGFTLGGAYIEDMYAQWEPKSFHILYETGLPDSVQVDNMPPTRDDFLYTEMEGNSGGSGYRRLSERVPTAGGYTFAGWNHFYIDADGVQHDSGSINTNGIPLYAFLGSRDATVIARAKWRSNFTLKYYRNLKDGTANIEGDTGIAE